MRGHFGIPPRARTGALGYEIKDMFTQIFAPNAPDTSTSGSGVTSAIGTAANTASGSAQLDAQLAKAAWTFLNIVKVANEKFPILARQELMTRYSGMAKLGERIGGLIFARRANKEPWAPVRADGSVSMRRISRLQKEVEPGIKAFENAFKVVAASSFVTIPSFGSPGDAQALFARVNYIPLKLDLQTPPGTPSKPSGAGEGSGGGNGNGSGTPAKDNTMLYVGGAIIGGLLLMTLLNGKSGRGL